MRMEFKGFIPKMQTAMSLLPLQKAGLSTLTPALGLSNLSPIHRSLASQAGYPPMAHYTSIAAILISPFTSIFLKKLPKIIYAKFKMFSKKKLDQNYKSFSGCRGLTNSQIQTISLKPYISQRQFLLEFVVFTPLNCLFIWAS